MKIREAEATLRIIKAQVEDAKRCVEGLRLEIQQTDRPERRAELNNKLQQEDSKFVHPLCKETGAEQRLAEIRPGQYAGESPDELFASNSSNPMMALPSNIAFFCQSGRSILLIGLSSGIERNTGRQNSNGEYTTIYIYTLILFYGCTEPSQFTL
ncbi:unnamed protein product [Lasius platythorax]